MKRQCFVVAILFFGSSLSPSVEVILTFECIIANRLSPFMLLGLSTHVVRQS
jgi:hypothetical protein